MNGLYGNKKVVDAFCFSFSSCDSCSCALLGNGPTGVSIQPFQTPPMARPRFHSHTESLMRSGVQHTTSTATAGLVGGMQNFNSLPVKDTNGRNGNSSGVNNKIAIEEDDIIPVKEVAPLSVSSTVVAASPCPPLPAKIAAEKDIVIIDKDFDDKIKSNKEEDIY